MSEIDSYRTIAKQSQAYLKELGSKFHAIAFPIQNEQDAMIQLQHCKDLFPGATHYCYAWRLGMNAETHRVNDDGEPSNSAGQPILRAILSLHLTNVFVVVVRYYGGKKLGIPGLISSYGNVAHEALIQSEIITIEAIVTISIKDITKQNYRVYEFVNRYELDIVETPNQMGGDFLLNVKKQHWPNLESALKELPNFDWRLIDTHS